MPLPKDYRRLGAAMAVKLTDQIDGAFRSLGARKKETLNKFFGIINDGLLRTSSEVAGMMGVSRARAEQLRDAAFKDLIPAFAHYLMEYVDADRTHTPLKMIGLSPEIAGRLEKHRIKTVERLLSFTKSELENLIWISPTMVQEIRGRLASYGTSLKPDLAE